MIEGPNDSAVQELVKCFDDIPQLMSKMQTLHKDSYTVFNGMMMCNVIASFSNIS